MATYSKQLFLTLIHKISKNNGGLSLGNNFRSFMPVVHSSTSTEFQKGNLSKAMKAYLEKSVEYDNFLREQLNEFNMGKKFLATMMGKKGEMTQKDIDEAIEYLFPCGLFVPKSRPIMKPPQEVFPKPKSLQFDNTGRPFHFLFYTGRQNYTQCLHDAAVQLKNLDDQQNKLKSLETTTEGKKLILVGSWITKENLEKKLSEKLFTIEYTKFIEVFTRLSEHPLAYMAEDFIKQYWIAASVQQDIEIPKPEVLEDGTQTITIHIAQRKTACADVKLICPGEGRIRINNLGLDYFLDIQARQQVNVNLISLNNYASNDSPEYRIRNGMISIHSIANYKRGGEAISRL